MICISVWGEWYLIHSIISNHFIYSHMNYHYYYLKLLETLGIINPRIHYNNRDRSHMLHLDKFCDRILFGFYYSQILYSRRSIANMLTYPSLFNLLCMNLYFVLFRYCIHLVRSYAFYERL